MRQPSSASPGSSSCRVSSERRAGYDVRAGRSAGTARCRDHLDCRTDPRPMKRRPANVHLIGRSRPDAAFYAPAPRRRRRGRPRVRGPRVRSPGARAGLYRATSCNRSTPMVLRAAWPFARCARRGACATLRRRRPPACATAHTPKSRVNACGRGTTSRFPHPWQTAGAGRSIRPGTWLELPSRWKTGVWS